MDNQEIFNQIRELQKQRTLLSQAFSQLDEYNKGGATQHNLLWKAMGNIEDALKEFWAEKHQPFGWTKLIGAIEYSFITDVDDNTNYSGEIPEDECSSIWNNNNEVIGKEKGVSVYEAHKWNILSCSSISNK